MNQSIALLTSAARTSSGASPALVALAPGLYFGGGLTVTAGHIVVDVTAVSGTTPTLVVTVEGVDQVSGKTYPVLATATINATGTTVLKIGRGLTAAANAVANDILPPSFRVSYAIGGTTPSFTFSVGALLT